MIGTSDPRLNQSGRLPVLIEGQQGNSAYQAVEIELHELALRVEPGDVIAITLEAVSNTAACVVGFNWNEN